MVFNNGSNSYLLQSLRIMVYTLLKSPISKSCPLFFYDAHPLHLIHGCPTHRPWSQGIQFLVLCAITGENSCPKVTHSPSSFPAQKPSVPAPYSAGFNVHLTTWLPRGGQGHSLTHMSTPCFHCFLIQTRYLCTLLCPSSC